MKLLRLTGLVFFVLSSAAFLIYRIYIFSNTDKTGPEITFPNDTIYTEVNADIDILLNDVNAFDEKDGDVTETLIIEDISKFISPGKRIITYAAYDKSNNIAKKERYLIYSDYESPRFSLTKPLMFNVGEYSTIIDNMKVYDCIDGDLSNNIRFEMKDITYGDFEGEFEVVFWVTNSCGDTSYLPTKILYYKQRYDNTNKTPNINLEDYIVYIDKGNRFYPERYPISFDYEKNEYSFLKENSFEINGKIISKNMIKIYSNVDVNTPGVYHVDYSLTIDEGYTGNTRLIVVVE